MHTVRIPSTSLEPVRVEVSARDDGAFVALDGLVVEMAFMRSGKPAAGDWKVAGWDVDGERFFAEALVGPGGVVALAPGTYRVWVRVTGAPDKPVREAGEVSVY